MGVGILFSAPLLNEFWAPPKKDKNLMEFDAYLKEVKAIKFQNIDSLRTLAIEENMPLSVYIRLNDSIENEYAATRKINWAKRGEIQTRNNVFGFRSMRVFMIGAGTRVVILFLSILVLCTFFVRDKISKKIIKIAALVYIAEGIYLNIWYLLPSDNHTYIYRIGSIVLSIVGGLLTYYYLKNRKSSIQASKEEINDKLDDLSLEFHNVIEEIRDIEIISKAIEPNDNVQAWKIVTLKKAREIYTHADQHLRSIEKIQK